MTMLRETDYVERAFFAGWLEALWMHIYDYKAGERPDRNCKYSQWLNDCDRFLLGKEVET